MLVFTSRLVIVLLVTLAFVDGNRRFIGDRRRYHKVQKTNSFRKKMINLESQLDLCLGKFLCGIRTVDNQCHLECVDEGNVCDGTIDCNNGRDEINCQGLQTSTPCPNCPTIEPRPEETPCPSSACPAGEIRCGDGSACKSIQDICDGTDQCPPGDTVDDTILQCTMGSCPANVSPSLCYTGFTGANIIAEAEGIFLSDCLLLCNINEACIGYIAGVGSSEGYCVLFSKLPTNEETPCNNPTVSFALYSCD